ncbi:hypothetical protein, partial [Falsiroseomonas sp. CW058]|uniref:hypothetical protein n=1 Tax=Falsiroseomonas sp. CW058 TaxID=3388664 RepID=UPI003D313594
APAVPLLALLVALPGLGVVAAGPRGSAARLGAALLLLGAAAVLLGLMVEGAPVAAGLIPPEALWSFRLAMLGAGFVPVLAALVAAIADRAGPAWALPPLLLLAAVQAAAAVLPRGTAWSGAEALAAPVLAVALAAALLWRRG